MKPQLSHFRKKKFMKPQIDKVFAVANKCQTAISVSQCTSMHPKIRLQAYNNSYINVTESKTLYFCKLKFKNPIRTNVRHVCYRQNNCKLVTSILISLAPIMVENNLTDATLNAWLSTEPLFISGSSIEYKNLYSVSMVSKGYASNVWCVPYPV